MAWRIKNPFKRADPHVSDDVAGQYGFGAPLAILYKKRPLPPSDNAAQYAYQTYLSPVWTPIGGGIPNQRDIGTAPPAWARQGVLVQQVGSPGILAGSFAAGPLTNVTTDESPQPIPGNTFMIPAH